MSAGLLMVGGTVGVWQTRIMAAHSATADADAKSARMALATERLIKSDVRGFAKAVSVDHITMFRYASELWSPGAVVAVKMTPSGSDFTVSINTDRTVAGGGTEARFVDTSIPEDRILAVLNTKPPRGVVLSEIRSTGDFNAFSVKYHYQGDNDPVRDLVGG